MNEQAPKIPLPPPQANKFGAFGRGGYSVNGGPDRQPYLDVDAFLARLNPLSSLLKLLNPRGSRTPSSSAPARSASYLSEPLQRAVKNNPILSSIQRDAASCKT